MRTVPGDQRMGRAVAGFYGSPRVHPGAAAGRLSRSPVRLRGPLWAYAATCGRRRHVPEADPQARARTHEGGRRGAIRRLPWGRAFAAGARERVHGAVDRRRPVPDAAVVVRDGGARPVGVPGHDGPGRFLLTEFFVLFPAGSVADRRRRKHVLVPRSGAADRGIRSSRSCRAGGVLGRSGLRRRDDGPVPGRGAGRHAVRRGTTRTWGRRPASSGSRATSRSHRAARRGAHGAGLWAAMGDRAVRGPGGAGARPRRPRAGDATRSPIEPVQAVLPG